MGFFDYLQDQQNADYIKAFEYLEQLAKQHNSTIRSTATYLLNLDPCLMFSNIYCQERGNYVVPAYDETPVFVLFFNNAIDMHTDEKYVLDEFKKNNSHLYFHRSELLNNEEIEVEKEHYLSNTNEGISDLVEQLEAAKITIEQLNNRAETAELNNILNNDSSALMVKNKELNNRLNNAKEFFKKQETKICELTELIKQSEVRINELAKNSDIPINSNDLSNIEIQNIKKSAIKQFNKSLAMALIDLDYQGHLRKGDIVHFIMPYMKKLAFVLADESVDKAKNLTVTYNTVYDTHLQELNFKQGRPSNADKNKVNIDLLFKKQLPITE